MLVDKEEAKVAQNLLWPDEAVEATIKQRRIGPGGSVITPTTVIATNKRIIIVNRTSFGIRRDYEVIPYRQITSVRLERGIISSSIFIRIQGYDTDKGLLQGNKQEGQIDGLRTKDAEDFANYLDKKISEWQGAGGGAVAAAPAGAPDEGMGAYIFCNKCGAKNKVNAKFCASCGAKLTT